MTSSSIFFDVAVFVLSSLMTDLSFISVPLLVLDLSQFLFIRDWPEIQKSEIPPSEFCPISGDRGKLAIPNLAEMFVMRYYWILQNARVTVFTVSELLRENQQRDSPRLEIKTTKIKILEKNNLKIKILLDLLEKLHTS